MKKAVGIIGNGRVGTGLSHALKRTGAFDPVELVTHRAFIERKIPDADVYCITTPDAAIEEAAKTLVSLGKVKDETCVLHCSGVYSSMILRNLGIKRCASFHPARSFQKRVDTFSGCTVAIEGDSEAMKTAKQLAQILDATPVAVSVNKKALYHTATVFSSNFIAALMSIGEDLLSEAGFTTAQAHAVACDLAHSALLNLETNGLADGLTGPVARGDTATIELHRKALQHAPERLTLYDQLTAELKKLLAKR